MVICSKFDYCVKVRIRFEFHTNKSNIAISNFIHLCQMILFHGKVYFNGLEVHSYKWPICFALSRINRVDYCILDWTVFKDLFICKSKYCCFAS